MVAQLESDEPPFNVLVSPEPRVRRYTLILIPTGWRKLWKISQFHIAKSFSVMTILQPTKLFFVDENEKLVPESMEAGDVLVFAGDTDHCGAKWSKQGGHDAVASFQDCNNYRLF